MVELFGSDGGVPHAIPAISRKPQAEYFGEKVSGSVTMGGRQEFQKEVQNVRKHRPDGTITECTKRLSSRFYQLKTEHARTSQYLHWAKARPTAQC